MSWSYSGDPSSSTLDAVRFLIQDTVSTAPLLQNEEINWVIGVDDNGVANTSPWFPAVSCCRVIADRFARQPGSRTIGDVTINYGDLAKRYLAMAESLRIMAMRHSVPTPYAGGISLGDKITVGQNTDHNAGHFSNPDGTWRNPGVGGSNDGEIADTFTRILPS